MNENLNENLNRTTLVDTAAVVTGAGRGFGRAVAAALAGAGAEVVGIGRDRAQLDELAAAVADLGGGYTPIAGDAADPVLPGHVIDEHRPRLIVLNAGARPLPRPLHEQSWESFSEPWQVDVRQAFTWCREALIAPLPPGSTVIAFSSRAALAGSPLSGGYAGAKQTVRLITRYAAEESARAGLGIRFLSILPDLTPVTRLGRAASAAYARRQGVGLAEFVESRGETLRSEQVAAAVLELAAGRGESGSAFSLTAKGLDQLP